MKTLTVSQRMPLAEADRVGRYKRPASRGDCAPCKHCQAHRDSGRAPPRQALECGHRGDEVLWHSRPCCFVGCRHALYVDITSRGSLKLNFPDKDWDEIPQTCSLDVAEDGEHTLEEIGDLMNVTRERARQLEARGLAAGRRAEELDLRTPEERAAAAEYASLFGDDDWEERLDEEETPQPPMLSAPIDETTRRFLAVLQ